MNKYSSCIGCMIKFFKLTGSLFNIHVTKGKNKYLFTLTAAASFMC